MHNLLLAGVDDTGIWETLGKPGSAGISVQNPVLLGGLGNESGVSFFQKLIPALINILLVGGVLVFFFFLITGAIQWISSGGDKQKLESARGKISNALIGLIILFAVFAIVKLLENFFDISILTLDIGKLVIR